DAKSVADTARSSTPPIDTAPVVPPTPIAQKRIIVIGLGMVGLRFCEQILKLDTQKQYLLTVFGEEKYHAYNRVGLTKYFTHRKPSELLLAEAEWYHNNNLDLHLNDPITSINTASKTVTSASGLTISYDHLVLATGSKAFVPPIQGKEKPGVFVYRTIEDLDSIISYAQQHARRAIVVGGGLLGLEAAKACLDLGLQTTVLERSQWLMRRQLDRVAGEMLAATMADMGITTLNGSDTREIGGEGRVGEVIVNRSVEGRGRWEETIETDMVVLSCGIVPRDKIASKAGIECGKRGGIVVDDFLETSVSGVYAIGECVLHRGQLFGLVAPGYEMATILAKNLTSPSPFPRTHTFTGSDMSAKLKLFGVQVGSFGDYFAEETQTRHVSYVDPIGNMYKRFILSPDGKTLIGGILFGDTTDFSRLALYSKNKTPLSVSPLDLLAGILTPPKKSTSSDDSDDDGDEFEDSDQICACNDVSKGVIVAAVKEAGRECTVDEVRKCTKAGTTCGGCVPLVEDIVGRCKKLEW
ncbi:hypothetical protein HK097_002191, partial [Rhizophlyctis rosea]